MKNTALHSPACFVDVSRRGPKTDTTRTGLLQTLALWLERARTRRQLATLDDRLLRDIGLSPQAAQLEAAKSFWQA